MYNTLTTSGTTLGVYTAQAFITKGKQRIKQFGSNVYLNNNDTFEIELFNPNQKQILAKIKLNGSYISGGGIVLRPGERVFLERFLDENKKFVFSTYSINGDSKEAKKAIELNGKVDIEFYAEYEPIYYTNSFWFSSGTTQITGTNFNNTLTCGTTANTFTNDASTKSLSFEPTSFKQPLRDDIRKRSLSKEIETGRVEKGETSNQQMKYVNATFNTYSFSIISWQIKPNSQKPYTASDIVKKYCTECGAKIKKDTFKFCPNCGTRI
jgi:hypothetical protein